jgi:hypothetical protein
MKVAIPATYLYLCYNNLTLLSRASNNPHRLRPLAVGVIALSTVGVEPWTLEGDSGRGPYSAHRTITICTDRRDDLSVDRLLDLSGTTTLTGESVDHNFTPSSISK